MALEEVSQQPPRLVGEVRSRTGFNLRQVGLAVLLLQLPGDSADALLLGHIAPQAAQIAFYQPQVPEFFAQCHILQIAIYLFQFAIYVKRNRRSEVRMQLVENKIHCLIAAAESCSASSVFSERSRWERFAHRCKISRPRLLQFRGWCMPQAAAVRGVSFLLGFGRSRFLACGFEMTRSSIVWNTPTLKRL